MFVRELSEKRKMKTGAIAKPTVDFASNLGLTDVESELDVNSLRQVGCDRIQGYYMCKPLPESTITLWLQECCGYKSHEHNILLAQGDKNDILNCKPPSSKA